MLLWHLFLYCVEYNLRVMIDESNTELAEDNDVDESNDPKWRRAKLSNKYIWNNNQITKNIYV